VAAEIAPVRRLAGGQSHCERNTEESDRAQRRGPPAHGHAPAGHPGEKVANARTAPDQRRHHECREGRAEKRRKWVGPPTPFFTTSPAATNGNIHAHETTYANTPKDASGERLIAPAIRSSVLVTPGV
jgi:hypothetical protein